MESPVSPHIPHLDAVTAMVRLVEAGILTIDEVRAQYGWPAKPPRFASGGVVAAPEMTIIGERP